MVSVLNDEAQREAHNNYLSKMKKKAEQEQRLLKRKTKREAKLNAKIAQKRNSMVLKHSEKASEAAGDPKAIGSTFGGYANNKNDGTKTEKSDYEEDQFLGS